MRLTPKPETWNTGSVRTAKSISCLMKPMQKLPKRWNCRQQVKPVPVQVATATTQIKCIYGQDMDEINLQDYVKNADAVGEVSVKVATGSTMLDGMQLDGKHALRQAHKGVYGRQRSNLYIYRKKTATPQT